MSEPVVSIRDLTVTFPGGNGARSAAVRDFSLELSPGTFSALVGESGSGKSVSAMSVLRLVPSPPARVESGEVLFRRDDGSRIDLLTASPGTLRAVRGGEIAMIFQEPMTSLNPVLRIGNQVTEAIRLHRREGARVGRREADRIAAGLLERVGIPEASKRMRQYPHEFSGGMRQRVMIAMALACRPRVLIADEPTTALDVTIQASILDLIRDLVDDEGLSVLLITHDLALVRSYADRIAVMYRGYLLEEGTCAAVHGSPAHPYTRGLLATVPDLEDHRDRLATLDSSFSTRAEVMTIAGDRYLPWTPEISAGRPAAAARMVQIGSTHSVRATSG